jgi:hypothetical protein
MLLKTFARKNEPTAENTQPNKPILPKLAIAAGSKKTPAPIILPATREVLVHKPNFFSELGIAVNTIEDDKIGFLLNTAVVILYKWPKLGFERNLNFV